MELLKISKFTDDRFLTTGRLLFAARMLVIYLIFISETKQILPPFLPFFSFFDTLREIPWLFTLIDLVYWLSLGAILIGYKFQKFCFLLSILIFFQILSSKNQYSTSLLYSGCLFFLIGIFQPGFEWTFRIQIALLYLGAGLNKLLDYDWLSGQYFENFILNIYPNSLNLTLANWVGERIFAQLMSYLTITIELGFGLWAILGRKQVLFSFAILSFHFSILVFTFGNLSLIYMYLMTLSSLLVFPLRVKVKALFF